MDDQSIKQAIEQVWLNYGNCNRMNMPAMVSIVLSKLNVISTFQAEDQVRKCIRETHLCVKGRDGGIMRPNLTAQFNASVERDLLKEVSATVAINNHTCPSCRNDRVSKSEHSCWKCGNKL
jgi:hypothetical protein